MTPVEIDPFLPGPSSTDRVSSRPGLRRNVGLAALLDKCLCLRHGRSTGGYIEDPIWLHVEIAIAGLGIYVDERWCIAEFLRVKGELLIVQNAPEAARAAGQCFASSLAWARRQEALSWELRSATSMARLWRKQRRVAEAVDLLAPIYQRFSEGFKTADLIAASLLLDELGPLRSASSTRARPVGILAVR
jgi:hypothetical protein